MSPLATDGPTRQNDERDGAFGTHRAISPLETSEEAITHP